MVLFSIDLFVFVLFINLINFINFVNLTTMMMLHNFHLRNPNFQLNKLSPLDNGTLVTFINNYLYAMIEMLNELVDLFETKLIDLNQRIDRIRSNLIILEMKLDSVSGYTMSIDKDVEIVNRPQPQQQQQQTDGQQQPQLDATTQQQVENQQESQSETQTTSNQSNEDNQDDDIDDDNLVVYKRMLRFGINQQAVRQKMIIDGFDPSLLNL